MMEAKYFADRSHPVVRDPRSHLSIFASSPTEFTACGELESHVWVNPNTWMQTNRGFHAKFPIIQATIAKRVIKCKIVPDYIDDDDYLLILNCGQTYESSYLQEDNY